jgi:hypothetical protein
MGFPRGATRIEYRYQDRMLNQVLSHAESWYQLAGSLGIRACNGELYLVTGADKCANWCLGVFPNASGQNLVEFSSSSAAGRFNCQNSGSALARRCPVPGHRENQCAFIRGFKMTLSENVWKRFLVGPVKASDIVTSHPDEILANGKSFPRAGWFHCATGRNSGKGTTVCGFPRGLCLILNSFLKSSKVLKACSRKSMSAKVRFSRYIILQMLSISTF